MRGHLTDQELMEALDGRLESEAQAHLRACAACRAERYRMRVTLAALAEETRLRAERQEVFWTRQRREIALRLAGRKILSPRWVWAWAPALLLLLGLGSFLFRGEAPQPARRTDADYELLLAVDRSLRAAVPAALRPAALLASEVERHETETTPAARGPEGDQP